MKFIAPLRVQADLSKDCWQLGGDGKSFNEPQILIVVPMLSIVCHLSTGKIFLLSVQVLLYFVFHETDSKSPNSMDFVVLATRDSNVIDRVSSPMAPHIFMIKLKVTSFFAPIPVMIDKRASSSIT